MDAANVEGLEVVCGAAGIEQDSADEEAGENEEQIYAGPATSKYPEEAVEPNVQAGVVAVTDIVAEKYEKDG